MGKLKTLLKASTMSIALLSGVAVATTVVTADVAYAKGGNSGDKGNSGGGKGASGDKGNSANAGKGRQKTNSNASRGGNSKAKGGKKSGDPIQALRGLFKKDDARTQRKVKKSKVVKKAAPTTSPAPAPKPKGNRMAAALGVHPSELGALNAANASPQALANASPNSRVGKIALYAEEVENGKLLREDLAAAQAELELLDAPERTAEEIDADLMTAGDERLALEENRAALQELLDEAGGDDADIAAELAEVDASLELIDENIASLEQERADGEAYAQAAADVAELEEVADTQAMTQREALEAAANKEVTDAVEIAVQKMLGIYEEPEMETETDPVAESVRDVEVVSSE